MSDIFISYAIEDLDRIKPLVKALEDVGWSVWWDRSMLPGSRWQRVLRDAIGAAKCVMVAWSETSITSEWVEMEAEEGRRRGILVPVLLDDVVPPFPFGGFQAARLIGGGGFATEPEFERVVRAVSAVRPTVPSGKDEGIIAGHTNAIGQAKTGKPYGYTHESPHLDEMIGIWGPQHTLIGHRDAVLSVAITPDGRRAVSASDDGTLEVWDLHDGRALRELADHSSYVADVALAPDGEHVVSVSGDETLKLWQMETGRVLRTLNVQANSVIFMPDGSRVLCGSHDNTLRVWDVKIGRALSTLKGHTDTILDVALTRDGRYAVSASADRTLKVWDLEAAGALYTLEGHGSDVICTAVTPDGRHAVSGSFDRSLKIWELNSGRALRTLEGHRSHVLDVAMTPNGRFVISASGDRTLKFWELETGVLARTLEAHADAVNCVAATADGRIVSGSADRTLKIWDIQAG